MGIFFANGYIFVNIPKKKTNVLGAATLTNNENRVEHKNETNRPLRSGRLDSFLVFNSAYWKKSVLHIRYQGSRNVQKF